MIKRILFAARITLLFNLAVYGHVGHSQDSQNSQVGHWKAISGVDGNNKECVAGQGAEPCCNIGTRSPDTVQNGCAWIKLYLGDPRPGSLLPSTYLRILGETPGPDLFTPSSLKLISGWNMFGISTERTADGHPREVYMLDDGGSQSVFYFDDDAVVGLPRHQVNSPYTKARLLMVDAEGWVTSEDPAYYDLYPGNGDLYRYVAYAGAEDYLNLRYYRSASGRQETFNESGIDIIRDDVGSLRQVRAGIRVADIVIETAQRYAVRIYEIDQMIADKNAQGLYEPFPDEAPLTTYIIEGPDSDNYNHLVVRKVVDESSTTLGDFTYDPAVEDWTLVKGDGEQVIERETLWNDNRTEFLRKYRIKNEFGTVAYSRDARYMEYPWGFEGVERIEGFGDLTQTTTYEFHTDPADSANYKRLKRVNHPDGSWVEYTYDLQNRLVEQRNPWKDDSVKSRINDYTSHHPWDQLTAADQRPRTVSERVDGQITAKTFYAYLHDPETGVYYEIEERSHRAEADFGDPQNPRQTTYYYASDAPLHMRGHQQRIEYPDGRVDTYSYSYGYYQDDPLDPSQSQFVEDPAGPDWLERVTHGTVAAPEGIAYDTSRAITVTDRRGDVVLRETQVYTGTDYVRVDWEIIRYNLLHHPLETIRANGDRESATWSHCCGKQIERQADGTEWVYAYDGLKRVLSKTKLNVDGSIGVTESYTYDANGNRLSETLSGGGLSLTTTYEYDALGRKVEQTDPAGLVTRWEYSADGLTKTEYLPNGATRITETYTDGRLKVIRGSAVVPEFYEYGVNADGSTWTRHFIGSEDASSPRWRKLSHDVLGRMVEEATPAYDGSIHLVQYSYNDRDLLERTLETGRAASLSVYNAMGELVRSGLDVDGDGQLNPASSDRIQDSEQRYVLEAGDWYQVRTNTVYPLAGNGDGLVVSEQTVRLTGWSGNVRAERVDLDIHGNATVRSTEVDPISKMVLTRINLPDSAQDSLSRSINGLLVEQGMQSAPTVYTYDALERVSTVKQAHHSQAATTQYDANTGQLILQTDAAGHATAYTYYANGSIGAGEIASVTDALLQKSYRSYDLLGRQTRTWGQTNYPQVYSYNSYGELETLTTWRDPSIDFSASTWPDDPENPDEFPAGDVTTWTYQPATGLLTAKTYADGNGTGYSYNSANRLAVRTWAREGGLDTTYTYDPFTGELDHVDYAAADTANIHYTYDRLGRVVTVTDATGTRSFDYDPATLQLDTETLDSSFYEGQVLQRTYQDGSEINGLPGRSFGYRLKDSGSTTTISSVDYSYDTLGRLQTLTDGTDTFTYGYRPATNLLDSLTAPQHSVRYTYEPNRDLMIRIDNQVSGNSFSTYAYSYDALGRRRDRSQSGTAFPQTNADTFGYNARSEVTASTNDVLTAAAYAPSYTYDAIGNRTSSTGAKSVSYSTNALNQYTAIDSANPAYDLDGNLISDGGSWTYSWNGENRLKTASNGSTTIEFLYDYQGRLVKKDDGTIIEVYLYDGWNRIAKHTINSSFLILNSSFNLWGLDLSGTQQAAGGVGGLLKEGSLYPTYDANGNILQKLDGNGATVMNVAYDPFGTMISGTLVGEYGFSTKPFINGPDWYYYGFRYYDPQTGRWPSRDPLGEGGGLNLFAFLTNSTVNEWDLLGLTACFDQDAFDDCADDCADDLQDCLDAADIAYDSCKNASDAVHGACYNLCENNTNSFLRNACRRGCDIQKGTGNSICFAAYVGLTSGCGLSATACTGGCAAGAVYTVGEGCPCDR